MTKEELKEQDIRLNKLCFDYQEKEKRIAELEKENAELKKKLKPENCLKLLAKEGYIKFTSDQLNKAKEIIRRLLNIKELQEENADTKELLTRWVSDKPYTVSEQKDLISDIKQFLKEVEK